MDERKVEHGRTIGSVKAAINMYGGKMNFHGPNSTKKPLKAMSDSKKPPSKTSELHLARKRIDQLNEDTKMAESEKSDAELQLLQAKKVVEGLSLRIEESKLKTKEEQTKAGGILEDDDDHEQVIREVEALKRELSELNLDMARAVEEKTRAEREAEAASLRLESHISSAEKLRREIEEANEEEVLVELAKIQARKELAEIEDQREEDRKRFVSLIEAARDKICKLREEMERVKDLEEKLSDANSDIQVLKSELNLIREMDERVERRSTEAQNGVIPKEELQDVKKELDSVQRAAFSMMIAIDGIRNELKEVLEERERMLKKEEETESSIRKLNSQILRAKDTLGSVTASEENEKLMLSTLSIALENLRKEKEEAMKQRESAQVEIASVRIEIQKTKSETEATEERLSDVMQELAAAKLEEEKALKKLKVVAEKVAKGRAAASKKKSSIKISRFEYSYLTGCALPAQELAEKKMAAAYAWERAVRDSEREMEIEIELAEEELRDLFWVEERELQRMEKSLNAEELDQGEVENQRRQSRKSMRENGYGLALVTQAKLRRSTGSPTARRRTSSLTLKRRRRMGMLRLGKYFASKQVVNEKGVPSEENV